MSTAPHHGHPHRDAFRHEALFYSGEEEFVERCASFIRAALAAEEAILVAVAAPKIDLLRQALDEEAGEVQFADMGEIGVNPARIIPVWQEFASRHAGGGRSARGIGEPISPARRSDELVECQRHESLINLAFGSGPGWWLACPYDTSALEPDVIEEACRSHPVVSNTDGARESADYPGADRMTGPFAGRLPDPRETPKELSFDAGSLRRVREFTRDLAAGFGLAELRGADLVLAVNEIATNSVRHGGGGGVLRVWSEGDALLCEVQDRGYIEKPLAGRLTPAPGQTNGHGIWLTNHLCDLVQVRSTPGETVVRMQMRLP
ncbi:MAG: anti-sigma factor RsbA family regulatory protein [Gaiellales bacterium]